MKLTLLIITYTIALASSLLISWKVQEYNLLLGYTIGVALMFTVALVAVDQITKEMK
jgi:hypothetical protein